MPTLSSPASIFEHTLDIIAGFTLEPSANLIFNSKAAAAVEYQLYEGRIVHLNSAGDFEPGCAGKQMPMVILPQSSPYGAARSISPYWLGYGKEPLSALVNARSVEVATTEYDTSKTYAINEFLCAPTGNLLADAAVGGVVTNVNGSSVALTVPYQSGGSPTTRTIVGMVAAPARTYQNGNRVLRYWTLCIFGAT